MKNGKPALTTIAASGKLGEARRRWGRCWLALLMVLVLGCGDEPSQGGQPGDLPPIVDAESLGVVAFNIESGDANVQTVSELVATVRGESLWGFSEVARSGWTDALLEAAGEGEGAPFRGVMGTTGSGIRLFLAYHTGILELLEWSELHHINVGGNVRAPLVGRMRHRASGQEFLFVVNHLYRSREERRHEQARLLNEWARTQTLPVVAAGDYNFDWHVENGEADHDQGYDLLTADAVFRWVRPDELIKTQCDERFNTVLDFVFVAGSAKEWPGESRILAPESGYCPDTPTRSDHRPVLATFQWP